MQWGSIIKVFLIRFTALELSTDGEGWVRRNSNNLYFLKSMAVKLNMGTIVLF